MSRRVTPPTAPLVLANRALSGQSRLGFALALSPGQVFFAGRQAVLDFEFETSPSAGGVAELRFADTPVARDMIDDHGGRRELATRDARIDLGATAVLQPPIRALSVRLTPSGVVLSWPAAADAAAEAVLEVTERLDPPRWTPVGLAADRVGHRCHLALDPGESSRCYRLRGLSTLRP